MSSPVGGIEFSFTEIRVSDWPRAVRWYVEVLGLGIVLEDAARRFALLEARGESLALKGADASAPRLSGVRLVFRVEDVDAERTRLRGLGVAVTVATDHPLEAYREIRLSDPEGIPLTLFSWRETPPEPAGVRLAASTPAAQGPLDPPTD